MRTGSPVTSCGSLISSSNDLTVSRSLSQKDRAAEEEADEERRADDIVSDCGQPRTHRVNKQPWKQTITQQKNLR